MNIENRIYFAKKEDFQKAVTDLKRLDVYMVFKDRVIKTTLSDYILSSRLHNTDSGCFMVTIQSCAQELKIYLL